MFDDRDPPSDLVRALGPSSGRTKAPPPRPDVSLQASDRYSTPPWLVELIRLGLGGSIDCDPFSDPTSTVKAAHRIDARKGGNGYVQRWRGRKALVNAGYSGRLPQLTAAVCRDRFMAGFEIFNVCPAAVGSAYWRADVWPYASAIVFLGRVAFPAGVDVYDNGGRLVCPAGTARGGNRTEIAAVYQGPHTLRVRRLFEHRGEVVVLSR